VCLHPYSHSLLFRLIVRFCLTYGQSGVVEIRQWTQLETQAAQVRLTLFGHDITGLTGVASLTHKKRRGGNQQATSLALGVLFVYLNSAHLMSIVKIGSIHLDRGLVQRIAAVGGKMMKLRGHLSSSPGLLLRTPIDRETERIFLVACSIPVVSVPMLRDPEANLLSKLLKIHSPNGHNEVQFFLTQVERLTAIPDRSSLHRVGQQHLAKLVADGPGTHQAFQFNVSHPLLCSS